jgi:translocator protein
MNIKMNIKKILVGILMTSAPIIAGSLIGYYYRADEWYQELKKPTFTPNPIVFQIVWPILYFTIGLSAFLALYGKKWYYWLVPGIQLGLNLSFSPITFGYHNLLWGSIIVTLTFVFALLTVIEYFLIDKKFLSVILMLPYIAWLVFANMLSWSVYNLNN